MQFDSHFQITLGRRPPVDDCRKRYFVVTLIIFVCFFYFDFARYCPFGDRNLFCYVINFDFARYCPFRDARLGENQGVAALGELAKVGLVTCFRCHGLAQQIQLVAVCT